MLKFKKNRQKKEIALFFVALDNIALGNAEKRSQMENGLDCRNGAKCAKLPSSNWSIQKRHDKLPEGKLYNLISKWRFGVFFHQAICLSSPLDDDFNLITLCCASTEKTSYNGKNLF
jgi:hypothetical protein